MRSDSADRIDICFELLEAASSEREDKRLIATGLCLKRPEQPLWLPILPQIIIEFRVLARRKNLAQLSFVTRH
jgi:hypothetical protein